MADSTTECCAHNWRIDTEIKHDGWSRGVCKLCGEEKDFISNFEAFRWKPAKIMKRAYVKQTKYNTCLKKRVVLD